MIGIKRVTVETNDGTVKTFHGSGKYSRHNMMSASEDPKYLIQVSLVENDDLRPSTPQELVSPRQAAHDRLESKIQAVESAL